MDTTLQILQKVHLIVTGVPIDGAVRDIFAARAAKEGLKRPTNGRKVREMGGSQEHN